MPFQNKVNLVQAPAVEGDFASSNPRAAVLAGPGGLVAGPLGVRVGRFAWVEADLKTTTNFGQGGIKPSGFVHRDNQALITQYLGEASLVIPVGFPVTLFDEGDFWAKVAGSTAAAPGSQAYANYTDGSVSFGSVPTGATATGAMGSTNTAAIGATFTATGTGDQLVVTAVTGKIYPGDFINGTGVPAGTTILSQASGTANGAGTYVTSGPTTATAATVTAWGSNLVVSATTGVVSIGDTVAGGSGFPVAATVLSQVSGTAGGAGTYLLSAPATQYVASATGVTTFGTTLVVSVVGSGTLAPGQAITGTGIPTGASIETQVSGTPGGAGTYTTNIPATAYAASTAITVVSGILTSFYAKNIAAVGELVKISTWGN